MKRFFLPGPESILSIGVLAVFGLAILFPSALTHSDPATGVAKDHLLAPDWTHWFGTDQLGRDVLTRIVYGARETLPAALLATLTGVVFGAFIGGLAALSTPIVDAALSGIIDVLLSIPELLLALTVVILTGFGPVHAAVAVGISQTASFARIIRNLVRSLRAMPYIEAARLSGTGFGGLIWWHFLPNAFRLVLGLAVLRYSMAILSLATLGFLGYGAPPSNAGMGTDDCGRPRLSGDRLVDDYLSRSGPADRRVCNQPPQPRHDTPEGTSAMNTQRPVLDVSHLGISYDGKPAVENISFQTLPGQTLALIGESGSGKSTIAKAIIQMLPPSARLMHGTITLNGISLPDTTPRGLNAIRGRQIGFIPQDPSSSLDPRLPVGRQIEEVLRLHTSQSRSERREHVLHLLEHVGFSEPERRFSQFPHELSGGMKQRVLIAIAVALAPPLIIADEPTSALDVTIQSQILDLLDRLREESGSSVLMITHDLAVARDRAHDMIVLRHGQIAEQNTTRNLFENPRSSYTRKLLADSPAFHSRSATPDRPVSGTQPTIQVKDLTIAYGSRTAVSHISFDVQPGTTHGIIGESGSGKTTLLRCLMGLIPPQSGSVHVHGKDIFSETSEERRQRLRNMQLVYQNPWSSLDPRLTIRRIIEEPLRNYFSEGQTWRQARLHDLLERVHLPLTLLERYPSEISGGQCQRVALARALAAQPDILVLDEFVSALDVTVQARILELLSELQKELNLTFVFVSHDLAVVRQIADTLSIIRYGKQEEYGEAEQIFREPASSYTQILLQSIPGQKHSKAQRSVF